MMPETITHLKETAEDSILIAVLPPNAQVHGAVYATDENMQTGAWRISGDGSAIDEYGNPHAGAAVMVVQLGNERQLRFCAGPLFGQNYFFSGFVTITTP